MPSVAELSSPYANFMIAPRHGPGVCRACFNLTDGYDRCYACARGGDALDLVVPISYSVGGEQLHRALAGYKRLAGEVARRFRIELAAVLWRFLGQHERCIAAAAGVDRFEIVTTVPSSDRRRDEHHPLRAVVGELTGPTRERHRRLLARSTHPVSPRTFDPARFVSMQALRGETVLLVDDMWTTGASAQSAAATLRAAGAGAVAAVVIGRHMNRPWHQNYRRLRGLTPAAFNWERCVTHAGDQPAAARRSASLTIALSN